MKKKHLFFYVLLPAFLLAWSGCAAGPVDFSGRFFVTVGPNPRAVLEVNQSGNDISFTMSGPDFDIQGTGEVTENSMTMTAVFAGFGDFYAEVFSGDNGGSFTGDWTVTGPTFMEGTISGTRSEWTTYDLEADGIPLFISADCIDLPKMERVSKFRSGEGLDYSDDFENCRSMKHSFGLKPGVDPLTARMYSPVNGRVIGTLEDWEGTALWKGTTVGIRPDGWPAFWIILFHLNADPPLDVGDRVFAGQPLGKSEKPDGGTTVIVWVHTPEGDKLLSYFLVITDTMFSAYTARGMLSRYDAVISKTARDADPLTCDGEEIVDRGHLAHWFILN